MGSKVTALGDRPLSPRRALERIRQLWNAGVVRFSGHVAKRMRERELDNNDVEHVFRQGRVTAWSRPMTLWRYEVEGAVVDGRRARVVVEINGVLVIVTAIRLRR